MSSVKREIEKHRQARQALNGRDADIASAIAKKRSRENKAQKPRKKARTLADIEKNLRHAEAARDNIGKLCKKLESEKKQWLVKEYKKRQNSDQFKKWLSCTDQFVAKLKQSVGSDNLFDDRSQVFGGDDASEQQCETISDVKFVRVSLYDLWCKQVSTFESVDLNGIFEAADNSSFYNKIYARSDVALPPPPDVLQALAETRRILVLQHFVTNVVDHNCGCTEKSKPKLLDTFSYGYLDLLETSKNKNI